MVMETCYGLHAGLNLYYLVDIEHRKGGIQILLEKLVNISYNNLQYIKHE